MNCWIGRQGFFTEIINSINYAHLGAIIVTIVSLAILIAFNKVAFLKKIKAATRSIGGSNCRHNYQ